MPDVPLIERVVAGDKDAFAALVEAHQATIFGYLRARLFQATDAEDLTQEVFLRFYVSRAKFDQDSLVRPWLLGIARNLLREHARKMRRRNEVAWTELCLELDDLLRPAPGSQDDGPLGDAMPHLPECLERLGPSARTAIQLRYQSSCRLAAIGKQLRRSEGAVKLLMFRARQALRHCLDGKLKRGQLD